MDRPARYSSYRMAAYRQAGHWKEASVQASIISAAPCIRAEMSTPATAMGSRPTAVSTLYRPPTSSGTTKVSHPSLSARDFRAPRALSVVA